MADEDILTPLNRPHHSTIGRIFTGYSTKYEGIQTYFCDSYDPRIGFWLTNVDDPADRKNVSERAIGGTFHRVYTAAADELAERMQAGQGGQSNG